MGKRAEPPNDFSENAEAATKVAPAPKASAKAESSDSGPNRQRMATVAMTEPDLGEPPPMPTPRAAPAAPPPRATTETNYSTVEDPTHMPHPLDLPAGTPTDPARPPGIVPRGDSRSMRRGATFALVYRLGTFVISRTGEVGQRGVWRVIDYPTTLAASGAYARECSRWVDGGFTDFRG